MSYLAPDSWFEYRNDAGEQIPAYAAVRLTGVVALEPGRVVVTASKPDAFGSQIQCALNGPQPVEAGSLGIAMRGGLAAARYETADGTPLIGEKWGPREGEWKLRKHTGGFNVVGVTNATTGLVLVQPSPMRMFIGKTDTAFGKGATGTISLWAGPLGAEVDTNVDISGVYNRFANVASGKWVRCEWNEESNTWELTAAEC